MRILLKRNSNSSSSIGNLEIKAGEPIWFKDKLYIGSVGSTAGGTQNASAGDEILIGPYTGNNGITVDANGIIKHTNTGKTKSSGLYKITVDDYGHITAATAVTKEDITNLQIPGQDTTYTAGTGLSLSGTTFNHSNSVTAKATGLYKLSYDAQGHITNSSAVTKADITGLGIPEQDTDTHLAHTITFTNAGATTPTGNSVAVITSIPKIQTSETNGNATVNPTTVNVPTIAYVNTAISNLKTEVGNPMMFRGSLGTGGTVTSLPTNPEVGDTYKVITATSINNVGTAKVGDTIIYTSTGWVIIPSGDEPSGTVTSVGLSVPTGLTVSNSPITSSGTIAIGIDTDYQIPRKTELYSYKTIKGDTTTSTTASAIGDTLTIAGTAPISTVASTDKLTISHGNSGVSAASYPTTLTSQSQLDYNSTFNVPTFTVDARGHLTAAGSVTYKIPASDNTDTKVTAVGNHYTPTGGTDLTPTVSSTGSYTLGVEYEVITGVEITKDAAGHVTGASVTKQKVKDTNTNDRYTFSTDATTGNFSVTNSGTTNITHTVTLTEIDGGTF